MRRADAFLTPPIIPSLAVSDDGEASSTFTPQSPRLGIDYKETYRGRTRRLTIKNELLIKMVNTAKQVYGPTAVVDIYSGSQLVGADGVRNPNTKPAGASNRHTGGNAADVRIIVNGRTLSGSELAPMGQAWLAQGYGGVGFGMGRNNSQTGIHLDIARPGLWGYNSSGNWQNWDTVKGRFDPSTVAAIEAGESGIMPDGTQLLPIDRATGSQYASSRDRSALEGAVDASRPVIPDTLAASYAPTHGGGDGSASGTFSSPEVGSKVWVFFHGGDPQKPVYFAQSQDSESYQQIYGYGG